MDFIMLNPSSILSESMLTGLLVLTAAARAPIGRCETKVWRSPNLNALGSGPQMKMITAALKSSVHVTVSVDGLPSNVNLWSASDKAFPEESFAMLRSLAAEVVSKK